MVSCVKMADPIEMLFRFWAWIGPSYHVLDEVHMLMERANFEGKGRPLTLSVSCAKMA